MILTKCFVTRFVNNGLSLQSSFSFSLILKDIMAKVTFIVVDIQDIVIDAML